MDVAALPYKIGQLVDGAWKEFRHDNCFLQESSEAGMRLKIGAQNPFELVLSLIEKLEAPLTIQVVYHSPRSDEEGARYQAFGMSVENVRNFLFRYRAAFDRDSRADLWLQCGATKTCVIWEKHDLIFVEAPTHDIQKLLTDKEFSIADSELPFPHTHHYHAEFDLDFQAMLNEFEWAKSPLEPGDGD